MSVLFRSPGLTVQMMITRKNKVDAKPEMFAVVGLDNMESYQLGPYPVETTMPQLLAVVATDMALDNKFGGTFKPVNPDKGGRK